MPTGDNIGAQYVSVGDNVQGLTVGGGLTTSGQISGNTISWPAYSYQYSWPCTHDAEARAQIAKLEGEVKVLREMVAALVAGRPQPKPRARKK